MKLSPEDTRFYRYNALGLLFLGALLFVFWRFPRIDFWISDLFFDRASNSFVYAKHWFWSGVMHEGVRQIMKIAHLVALIAWLSTFKVQRLRPYRAAIGYFLVASLSGSAIVGVLKDQSDRACPYHLIDYGGSYSFVPFFSGEPEAEGIHCWPGGHILHAFALLPIPFALRGIGHHRKSLYALLAVITWGLLLNYTQLLRGQHFTSHHLWTLFICWICAVVTLPLLNKFKIENNINNT